MSWLVDDRTVKLPPEVLEKLEVQPGGEIRIDIDDHINGVRVWSRREGERLDYLNWMSNRHCPAVEEMIAEDRKRATQNIVLNAILDGYPKERIAKDYNVSVEYVEDLARRLKLDLQGE